MGGFWRAKASMTSRSFVDTVRYWPLIRTLFTCQRAQAKSPVKACQPLRCCTEPQPPMRPRSMLFGLPDVASGFGNDREQSFGLTQRAMSNPAFERVPFFGASTSNSAGKFTSNSVENDILFCVRVGKLICVIFGEIFCVPWFCGPPSCRFSYQRKSS